MITAEGPWVASATIAFWVGSGALLYTYCLYPAMLWVTGHVGFKARPAAMNLADALEGSPRVDVIVSAFNEQQHVGARIHNILQQNYPPDLLRVLIGSDGSSDGTGAIIQSLSEVRVRAFVFEENRGKASVLNDLASAADADILVFTDANTEFAPDAVARLVRRFDDPDVCCVCGELDLKVSSGSNQDGLYWRIEQFLKRREADLGGLLGANGGIYAVRRRLFQAIPADTIVDDFQIAMNSALVSGGRQVYEPSARAHEETPDDMADEYIRRVRIGVGNYQILFRCPRYLFGLGPATTFTYLSHKVLRWLGPIFLGLILAGSIVLASDLVFAVLLAGQLAMYALAAMSIARLPLPRLPMPVKAVVFVLVLNIAFLVGFTRYIRGKYGGAWQRTARAQGL